MDTGNIIWIARKRSAYSNLRYCVKHALYAGYRRCSGSGFRSSDMHNVTGTVSVGVALDDDFKYTQTGKNLARDIGISNFVGFMANVRLLPDGSLTRLNAETLEIMGQPIDLDLPPTLTATTHPYNNLATDGWLDRRGTLSMLGHKRKELLPEFEGRRPVMVVNNRKRAYGRRNTAFRGRIFCMNDHHWKFSTGSREKLLRPGSVFLYRQKLRVYDPLNNRWVMVSWVGLATFDHYHNRGLDLSYWYSLLQYATDYSIKDFLNYRDLAGARSSTKGLGVFDRYVKTQGFHKEGWSRYQDRTLADYVPAPDQEMMKFVNADIALTGSGLSMQIKKMAGQLRVKKREVKRIRNDSQDHVYNMKVWRKEITDAKNRIKYQLEHIDKAQAQLEKMSRAVAEASTLPAKERIIDKIEAVLKKKRKDFDKYAEEYMQSVDTSELPDFAAGLAKTGIVIDDMIYERVSKPCRNKISARTRPEVVKDPEYRLCEVQLHTTKPIPIVFGLDEKGLPPRASGPHKIRVTNTDGQVSCNIKPAAPWSVIGTKDSEYKVFPHCPEVALSRRTPESYAESLEVEVSACMGMLADTAARSFRQNNVRAVAMAVYSWLSSCDPDDPWGKTYTWFPLLSEVRDYAVPGPPPAHIINSNPLQNDIYHISTDGKRYLRFTNDNNNVIVSYGDVKEIDGLLFETTCQVYKPGKEWKNMNRYTSYFYYGYGDQSRSRGGWNKFVFGRPETLENLGVPDWNPRKAPEVPETPSFYAAEYSSVRRSV